MQRFTSEVGSLISVRFLCNHWGTTICIRLSVGQALGLVDLTQSVAFLYKCVFEFSSCSISILYLYWRCRFALRHASTQTFSLTCEARIRKQYQFK